MKGPPRWLPWLGPPLAGLTVAVVATVAPFAPFWQVVGVGLAAGFAPMVANRIWKWWVGRR